MKVEGNKDAVDLNLFHEYKIEKGSEVPKEVCKICDRKIADVRSNKGDEPYRNDTCDIHLCSTCYKFQED